jgi:hypothetical protein
MNVVSTLMSVFSRDLVTLVLEPADVGQQRLLALPAADQVRIGLGDPLEHGGPALEQFIEDSISGK